eukprot:TRINITY_DN1025_c0_g1_i2.p1 TRINITY_DN1025_c0_g1~~TRINITY_DN1025_c0_g1_i2.p1  ORF type:complete len:341 (-),score=74.47 TRINITY_DN1025_c0_g1_i2:18-968(-)
MLFSVVGPGDYDEQILEFFTHWENCKIRRPTSFRILLNSEEDDLKNVDSIFTNLFNFDLELSQSGPRLSWAELFHQGLLVRGKPFTKEHILHFNSTLQKYVNWLEATCNSSFSLLSISQGIQVQREKVDWLRSLLSFLQIHQFDVGNSLIGLVTSEEVLSLSHSLGVDADTQLTCSPQEKPRPQPQQSRSPQPPRMQSSQQTQTQPQPQPQMQQQPTEQEQTQIRVQDQGQGGVQLQGQGEVQGLGQGRVQVGDVLIIPLSGESKPKNYIYSRVKSIQGDNVMVWTSPAERKGETVELGCCFALSSSVRTQFEDAW